MKEKNAGLHILSPAMSAIEDIAAGWVLGLLNLPPSASVGFVTGATMANMTALAAARHEVLRRAGWDVEALGLQGARNPFPDSVAVLLPEADRAALSRHHP